MTTATEKSIERLKARAAKEGLLDVAYMTADSPFGPLLLAKTERGLVRVGLPNQDADELLADLTERVSPRVLEAPRELDEVRRELDLYFAGKLDRFFPEYIRIKQMIEAGDLGTVGVARTSRRSPFLMGWNDWYADWRLSGGFRQRVLRAIDRIPYGQTRSYTEMARKAGNERAVRAAGTACGSNPIPLVVPCHRVLRTGGALGGYGGGLPMKEALLELEGVLDGKREP